MDNTSVPNVKPHEVLIGVWNLLETRPNELMRSAEPMREALKKMFLLTVRSAFSDNIADPGCWMELGENCLAVAKVLYQTQTNTPYKRQGD